MGRWRRDRYWREDGRESRERSREGFDEVTSGIAEAVDTIADSFSSAADPIERERRRRDKEEKRRRQEASSRRSVMGAGAGLLAGGLAASSGLVAVAAVGVGLLAGAMVIGAMRWFDERGERVSLPRPQARPALADPAVTGQDARASLIRSVVTGAMGHLRAIDRLAGSAADLETAAILTRIAAIGHRVCHAVAGQPALFEKAQRLLTYHAEKAAKLAELSVGAEGQRLDGVRRVLGRVELLFEQTEAALKQEDGRELDLELKLIDQALDEDLRR
jgi:hypothetical protein